MANSEWKECYTLGAKAKRFCWKYDDQHSSLQIRRQFENVAKEVHTLISKEQLLKIQDYIQRNPQLGLANNVEKLRLGTEKEGLGKFMYEQFGWSTTEAQLASHVAALFVGAGIWKKTQELAKRNIQLETLAKDTCWQARLDGFYRGSSDCNGTD